MSNISTLSEPLQQRLRSELSTGESLVWVGQPNPARALKSAILSTIFFIPWTAFSLFWIAGASGFKMPTFDTGWSLFPLFGTPFLLIGIWGLSAPLRARRDARYIIYALTNQRALAIEGVKTITVKSYLPGDIVDVVRTEHKDGSGDLVLRQESYKDSDGDSRNRRHGFFGIDGVRQVEKLVRNLTSPNRL
jgi:hypothetical protein